MEKRGFLAVEWIVAIVLILVGLGILVFAATNFFTKTDIDKNTCHFSVISRGSTPSLAKGYVPLRCKTEKICITGELFGGGCDEFKGEKGVTRIRVSDSSVQGLEQVQKVYAQSILECWEMMGEGKVGLFSLGAAKNFGFGLVYPSCVVCSRIAIDKDSLTNVPFENMNINEYMRSHLAPKTEKTYFDYMLGEEYAASYSVADNLLNLPDFDMKKDEEEKDIDLVKKDITLDQARNAVKLCKETGIQAWCSFIIGLPSETKEESLQTINFALELDPEYVQFPIFMPWPGTSIYETAKEYGIIMNEDLSDYTAWDKAVYKPTPDRDPEEVRKTVKNAYRKFYLRPKYVTRKAADLVLNMPLKKIWKLTKAGYYSLK